MIRLGRGLPAYALRIVTLLTVVLILVVLAAEHTGVAALGFVAAVGVLAVVLPASPAPALLIVTVAVLLALGHADPLRPAVLALVPLVHLVHLTCAYAALAPANARLHLAALRAPAVRFGCVQAIVFGLAGVAALLPTDITPSAVEVAGLLGGAALVVLVVRIVRGRAGNP